MLRHTFVYGVLFSCLLLLGFRGNTVQVRMTGKAVHDFRLPDTKGNYITLAGYKGAKGFIIVFTCNHCPFAKLYTARLNALYLKYAKAGVPLIAINPMDTTVYEEETMAAMKQRAANAGFLFPYVQDASQSVGKDFHAGHTPAAYVIWQDNGKWTVRYSGAIDDNGQHPEQAVPYIAHAVDELLAGKNVSQPETSTLGCAIHYR